MDTDQRQELLLKTTCGEKRWPWSQLVSLPTLFLSPPAFSKHHFFLRITLYSSQQASYQTGQNIVDGYFKDIWQPLTFGLVRIEIVQHIPRSWSVDHSQSFKVSTDFVSLECLNTMTKSYAMVYVLVPQQSWMMGHFHLVRRIVSSKKSKTFVIWLTFEPSYIFKVLFSILIALLSSAVNWHSSTLHPGDRGALFVGKKHFPDDFESQYDETIMLL